MSAVVLTEVVCNGFDPPSTRPRLFAGAFDVTPLSPTSSTGFISGAVYGWNAGPTQDALWLAARNMGKALVSTAAWRDRYILVVESLDDIANMLDARTMR